MQSAWYLTVHAAVVIAFHSLFPDFCKIISVGCFTIRFVLPAKLTYTVRLAKLVLTNLASIPIKFFTTTIAVTGERHACKAVPQLYIIVFCFDVALHVIQRFHCAIAHKAFYHTILFMGVSIIKLSQSVPTNYKYLPTQTVGMAQQTQAMIESERFKHSETCDLFNPRHAIPAEIAEIVEELDDMDGFSAISGGCNGCTAHLIDEGVYYVAQNEYDDVVYFGFTSESAAYTLIGACVEHNVAYDWSRESTKKVAVGTSDAY